MLGYDSSYELPTVIWQDNTGEQSWTSLDDFGNQTSQRTFSLGDGEKVIQNRYETKDYERYGKAYPTFLSDLYQDKAQQVTIDLPIEEDLHLNGKARLHLRLHSSTNKRPSLSPTLRAWKQEIPPTLSCSLIGPYTG